MWCGLVSNDECVCVCVCTVVRGSDSDTNNGLKIEVQVMSRQHGWVLTYYIRCQLPGYCINVAEQMFHHSNYGSADINKNTPLGWPK